MNNIRTTLLKILEIIDYRDNKDNFVDEFLKNLQLQSFLDLMQTLPKDKQQELQKQLQSVTQLEELNNKINLYFNEKQLKDSLENTARTGLANYIQAIDPSLSTVQKNNLAKLLE